MEDSSTSSAKLTIGDIIDLRAYERQRDELRAGIIALKKLRRVAVGPIITLVFENRDTIRFQIQEMARAERMLTDEAIRTELDTYNPLIPEPGWLSATLYVELTSKEQLVEWLPKLVGVERALELRIGDGDDVEVVRCVVEADHAAQLTREETTSAVHYIRFELSSTEIDRFTTGPAVLAVNHPSYQEGTALTAETRQTLLNDLRPGAQVGETS